MTSVAPLASALTDEPELVRLGRSCGEAAAAQVDDLACQMQKASALFAAAIAQCRQQLGRLFTDAAPPAQDAAAVASDELRAAMLALQAEDALEQMLAASIGRARHVAEGLRRLTPALAGMAAGAAQAPVDPAGTTDWRQALQDASACLIAGQSLSQPVQQQALQAGAIELF